LLVVVDDVGARGSLPLNNVCHTSPDSFLKGLYGLPWSFTRTICARSSGLGSVPRCVIERLHLVAELWL
jgi:hypothetical protein